MAILQTIKEEIVQLKLGMVSLTNVITSAMLRIYLLFRVNQLILWETTNKLYLYNKMLPLYILHRTEDWS